MEELVTRFYARFLTQDRPGDWQIGYLFCNHGVSLESVVQTGLQDQLAEIVVVTMMCGKATLTPPAEIRTLSAVDSIPSLLRVL